MISFEVGAADVKSLFRRLRKVTEEGQAYAAAATLNRSAQKFRELAVRTLSKELTVRTPFLLGGGDPKKARGFWIEYARPRTLQARAYARQGLPGNRAFTGWQEQETGERSQRERTPTLFARDGSRETIVRSRWRLRPNKEVRDVTGMSDRDLIVYMQILARSRVRGRPFFALKRRYKSMTPGVWAIEGSRRRKDRSSGTLRKIWSFHPGGIRVRRLRWAKMSSDAITDEMMISYWREELDRQMARQIERRFVAR